MLLDSCVEMLRLTRSVLFPTTYVFVGFEPSAGFVVNVTVRVVSPRTGA